MIAELLALAMAAGSPLPSPERLTLTMYRPAERSVSNWRLQALNSLDLDTINMAAILTGRESPRLPRCIRLNNYWCIKSARWNGEIATDNEGHVAFGSANDGASVAVALLRRYYLDLNRKSALSIVSRWAPIQCGGVAARPAGGARKGVAPARGNIARADGLATKGIGNTLRARYLASRGRGGGVRARGPVVRSVIADRPAPMMRAPTIAAGMGERAGERTMSVAAISPASLGSIGGSGIAPSGGGGSLPRNSCAGEAARVRNYATSIIQGLVKGVDDDLRLFESDGAPAPNLARAMANMAAVEIGPFRAWQPLIDRAIATALREAQEKRARLAAEKAAQTGRE